MPREQEQEGRGVRLSLTRSQAITLLTRLDDLAQLETEVEDVQQIRTKLRKLMGFDA